MSSPRIRRSTAAAGWTLVGAIAVAIALVAVSATLGSTIYGMPVALSFGLAFVHSAAVPLALRRPLAAGLVSAGAVTVLAFAQAAASGPPWPWAITTLVTHAFVLALVGLQARNRVGAIVWLLAVAGTVVASVVYPRDTDGAAINIIIATSVTGVVLVGGVVAREWRNIGAQLIREREVSAREHEHRMIAEEKTRIARELHDVVAHSMSVINAQASSAVYRHADVPPPIAREFDEIAAAARSAITELRGVLGVLRSEGAEQDLAPQPRLTDIPSLVESTARSGTDVSLEFDPELSEHSVSDVGGLTAYRVVQEAMSNAIRHAPGASIWVRCALDGEWVEVSVTNSPSIARPAVGEPGHGLLGMRERVLAVSGFIQAEPTPDGGFAVVARVPVKVPA